MELIEELNLANSQILDFSLAMGQLVVMFVDSLGQRGCEAAQGLALQLRVFGNWGELVAQVVATNTCGTHQSLAVVAIKAVGAAVMNAVVDYRRFSNDVTSCQWKRVVLNPVLLAQK